jgi:hypothetical protein
MHACIICTLLFSDGELVKEIISVMETMVENYEKAE